MINSLKYKNNRLSYYFKHFLSYHVPKIFFKKSRPFILKDYSNNEGENKNRNESGKTETLLWQRVNYYNKLDKKVTLSQDFLEQSLALENFLYPQRRKGHPRFTTYFCDTYKYTKYFPDQLKARFIFGDITHIPNIPSIVKSRPILGANQYSVLLNLDRLRHFLFIKDKIPFSLKEDRLIGRGVITQPHRIDFFNKYFDHPLCDLGAVNTSVDSRWQKKIMSIGAHLRYKFILCLEGNDVATNLKWVMSSNSLAVMSAPKYETWFMEGKLVAGLHYIQIKDDYSDLEEKLSFYISHPEKALEIIHNAHSFVAQFQDQKREDIISLLVLQKYFEKTGQKI